MNSSVYRGFDTEISGCYNFLAVLGDLMDQYGGLSNDHTFKENSNSSRDFITNFAGLTYGIF